MSTNYYVHTDDGKEIHLGKYANGWPFMFRGYLAEGVVDYPSWRALLSLGEIRTEAGTPVTVDDIEETVANARKWTRAVGSRTRADGVVDDHGNWFTTREFC